MRLNMDAERLRMFETISARMGVVWREDSHCMGAGPLELILTTMINDFPPLNVNTSLAPRTSRNEHECLTTTCIRTSGQRGLSSNQALKTNSDRPSDQIRKLCKADRWPRFESFVRQHGDMGGPEAIPSQPIKHLQLHNFHIHLHSLNSHLNPWAAHHQQWEPTRTETKIASTTHTQKSSSSNNPRKPSSSSTIDTSSPSSFRMPYIHRLPTYHQVHAAPTATTAATASTATTSPTAVTKKPASRDFYHQTSLAFLFLGYCFFSRLRCLKPPSLTNHALGGIDCTDCDNCSNCKDCSGLRNESNRSGVHQGKEKVIGGNDEAAPPPPPYSEGEGRKIVNVATTTKVVLGWMGYVVGEMMNLLG
ncbi:uncharacterized protein MYCFIDRAFT_174317 [Pseudocercospora fijiensis CIRAD86]|uniref:Uncharacterized protein n=1 Tax=Pseudocercospora fijiensis (strain CIRAD86) TaxID=383855 RepID=M2ZUV6_PSEFD|nr:uncharacterized protein MYCFIDRAFT_174317 [Pseudocercospora fijiensis CIRAD86]EME82774.1 hypothetical protein MYCFIDRAFT_174317 [Pseudocercospora fijiensis CIRAD86]